MTLSKKGPKMAVVRNNSNHQITLPQSSSSFEPVYTENDGFATRRELTRTALYKELLAQKLEEKKVVEAPRKKISLKKVDIPKDFVKLERLCQDYPLYESSALSFWEIHSHPNRKFRNTYNFTKPMSKYYDGPMR